MPSAKYSCSGSPPKFANGSTAIDGKAEGRVGEAPAGRSGAVRLGGSVPPHAEDAHRVADVLQRSFAEVVEAEVDLVADLIVDRAGDADPARLRHALQARRDVDPVAEQIVAADHDVAEVDADPKPHAARFGKVGVPSLDLLLDRSGAAHRLDRARELGHHAVAGGGEDPAVVPPDQLVDHLATGVQRGERAFLVGRHEARVAGDVGRENDRQLAGDARVVHVRPQKARCLEISLRRMVL